MKKLSKLAVMVGFGLLIAAFINVWAPAGIMAAGLWTFAFVIDKDFRGKF